MMDKSFIDQILELNDKGVPVYVNVNIEVLFGDKSVFPPGSDEPPVDEPPTDEPPTDEPPADEPPVDEPPVDEPPVDVVHFLITAEKALAHFQYSTNKKGFPIMMIYPTETDKDQHLRLRFDTGAVVQVEREQIKADKALYFYRLVAYKGQNGEALYLEADRGRIV